MRLAPDDPQSVVIRFFDADGIDIDEGAPAQDRAAVLPRGLPAGAGRRHRRHRLPAPSARVLHGRAHRDRRRRSDRAAGVQGRARLRVRLGQLRDAERAGQARRRRAGGQPVRIDVGRGQRSTACPGTPTVRRPGASVGCAPRRRDRPRRRAHHPRSTTAATSSPTTRPCSPCSPRRAGQPTRPASPCRSR